MRRRAALEAPPLLSRRTRTRVPSWAPPEGHPGNVSALLTPCVCSMFARVHVQEQVRRAELQYESLPQKHRRLLPNVLAHLAQISRCAEKNQELLQAVVHNSLHMFENIEYGQRVRPDSARDLWVPRLCPKLSWSEVNRWCCLCARGRWRGAQARSSRIGAG